MIEKSPTIVRLIRNLQQIPYLASKNIYRTVGHLLAMDHEKIELLCRALQDAKNNVVLCASCFASQEKDAVCTYCAPKRDHSVVCVVETWHELIAIEKTEGYKGTYHVLGGVLSPLEGIEPQDLRIEQLLEKVQENSTLIKEVILATNQTPEGEATAAYIARKLQDFNLSITCLARGVPVGSSLEFIDKVTVYKALAERRLF